MKAKLKKILMVMVVVLILGTSTTGMIFSIISFNKVNSLEMVEKDAENEDNDDNDEDDNDEEDNDYNEDEEDIVVIGDVYEIVPTEAISDAYISGDDSKLNEEDKVTLEVASEILEEIITEDMTDYEKEEAIYLWICENITTDEGGTVAVPEARGIYDRPYGVLQNKQAVCVGYATTFKLLVNMVGLECIVMHDTEFTHSWDIVQLDDGCWYIVDCYNDAGEYGVRYANFNMNEEMAYMSHDWDAADYPVANGTKYNYIEMSKILVSNIEDMIYCVAKFYEEETEFGVMQVPLENEQTLDEIYYIIDGIYYRLTTDYSDVYMEVYEGSEEDSVIVVYNYYNYEDDYIDDGSDYETDYEWIDTMLDDKFGTEDYWEDEYWEDEYWDEQYWEEDVQVEIIE